MANLSNATNINGAQIIVKDIMEINYFVPKEELEPMAVQQINETADLDFVLGVAVMPDAHVGKGSTVGSVIATKNAVIPAAVGVDIGCGMIAVKTKYKASDLGDSLKDLRLGIERRIPLSAGKYNNKVTETALPRIAHLKETEKDYYKDVVREPWENQLGSLGSGNHFIEISLDEEQNVWVVLHSGSRGIGNKLAEKHIKIAQVLLGENIPSNKDLAHLQANTPEFDSYIQDLLWAQDFARLNREEMMDRVMTELSYYFFKENGHQKEIEIERINCHHNFTQKESHCLPHTDNHNNDSQTLLSHMVDSFSKVRDFLVDYRPFVHSCGGLALFSRLGDRVSFPLQVNVLERIHDYQLAGGLALTKEHNLVPLSAHHCNCHNDRLPIASYEHNFVSKLLDDPSVFFGKCVGIQDKFLEQFFFCSDISSLSLHNYNTKINYNDKYEKQDVWLTRKGAIEMKQGQMGIIPGSMGTETYIVSGLGNPDSFNSAPHGSGRRFSRTEARKRFTMADFERELAGVEVDHKDAFIDEIPSAYKDIRQVMEYAKPLVEVKAVLKQVLNIKGD